MNIRLSSPLLVAGAGVVAILAGCGSNTPQGPAATSAAPGVPSMTSASRFTATGNEPFWSVSVDGGVLTYSTPEIQPGKQMSGLLSSSGDRVTVAGADGPTQFTLYVTKTACTDSMSGKPFEYTAEFVYGDQTLTGCARQGS